MFVVDEFAELTCAARKVILNPYNFEGIPHTSRSIAYISAGVAMMGILAPEAMLEAVQVINKAYAEINTRAVLSAFDLPNSRVFS